MGDGKVNLGGINPTEPNAGVHQDYSGGSSHTKEQGIIGGGKNEDSETNNFTRTHAYGNKTFFNPNATTEQVVTAAPAILYGYIGKVGTGTITFRDDNAVNGATPELPALTLAVGTIVTFPVGLKMNTGITAQCSVGTDEVTLIWDAQ